MQVKLRIEIRNVADSDLAAILALNEAAVPHVNSISLETLQRFAIQAAYFRVAWWEDKLAGVLIGLTPEVAYASLNFRWFRERYPNFVYIDRIIVTPDARRHGVARRLYQDIESFATPIAPLLTCEVNLRPRNTPSLEFHRRFGFREVGTQETEGGAKTVSLLVKELKAS